MRPIDADKLKEAFAVPCYEAFSTPTIHSIINEQPTVEIVNCEYCRWWRKPKHKALSGRCVGPIALWCKGDICTPKDFYCKFYFQRESEKED